jgi:hypothetical protein
MAFQIERGSYGAVSLVGLGFIILGLTPQEMGKGNWSVGLVTDTRATAEQRDSITAIASGAAGGPMSAVGPLVGTFLGVESARGSDGLGITVSYWESEEAIRAWKAQTEHRVAQAAGRDIWYEQFEVRIARVERAYGK